MNDRRKKDKLLLIKNDQVFKDMFNENQMDILEWMVMKILNAKYEDIHGRVIFKNKELTNTYQEERKKTVDLLVDYNWSDILIELNNSFTGNYMRNLLYAFNIISNHYNKGVSNNNIKKDKVKIILANLNWHHKNYNHKMVDGKKEVLLEYPEYNYEDYLIKIININLDFYYELCYYNIKESDRLWKLFTIENKEDLDLLVKEEKLLLGYQRKLLYLSDNEDYKKMILNEDIERNAMEEQQFGYAYDTGMKKGIASKEKEIVINMYKDGMSLELISKYSNLSLEEVNKIVENIVE